VIDPHFQIGLDPAGGPQGTPLVTAAGEIDPAAASQLDELLRTAGKDSRQVTVDLFAVDYLDTAGIRVLLDHAAKITLVVLLAANSLIAPAVTTSGLGRVATVRTVDR
jgi:anti-anti-sigma factor